MPEPADTCLHTPLFAFVRPSMLSLVLPTQAHTLSLAAWLPNLHGGCLNKATLFISRS